jgi:hypothetical protein
VLEIDDTDSVATFETDIHSASDLRRALKHAKSLLHKDIARHHWDTLLEEG